MSRNININYNRHGWNVTYKRITLKVQKLFKYKYSKQFNLIFLNYLKTTFSCIYCVDIYAID